ncbi:PREDICTED: guanine nucleotide exchange factor for Rab-3A isoform X6 [Corvus brachyrhynchos]|uniref:guanine nucleotide exchange factor for Rab-3A isoform X6 n=2 Tax=Corvus brachyrhynchos TaxID=85066 RepID=UPI0008165503|nr:PREDICTED: guanine nucleotide exchange factor for Rab-3A isoform X6 [Corvus brachyrhynchos]
MKNPIEKFLEGFSRGRNPPLEQGRSVRHPPLEEEGAAEPAAPIPYPAVRKEAEEARSDSEPRTKSGAEGRLLDISFELLIVPRQVSFEEESQNPPAVGHWKPLMPSKGDKEEPEGGCQDAGGVDEPQSTEQLNVSRLRSSSVEIREKGSEFLRDELHKAQKELKLKDKECERLSKVREQLEQELEELTASLFEEAHKMVREANTKQAAAEKQLREARGKIDMLQAEVTALKTLVITSTPSSPNRELHPQLQSPSKAGFRKGHGRNKSTSSAMVSAASQNVAPEPVSRECKEVDSILFAEFQTWKESPTLDKSCSFLDRIYREDVGPCLDFTKQELSELVRVAVEQNTLTIEPVASQTVPMGKVAAEECGGPKKCALSGLPRTCKHRIMLGDSGNYYYISPSCRARITAVCNFFTYIRYIQQGLVRQDVELMYWEVMRLRREMSLAKLGFYPSEMTWTEVTRPLPLVTFPFVRPPVPAGKTRRKEGSANPTFHQTEGSDK